MIKSRPLSLSLSISPNACNKQTARCWGPRRCPGKTNRPWLNEMTSRVIRTIDKRAQLTLPTPAILDYREKSLSFSLSLSLSGIFNIHSINVFVCLYITLNETYTHLQTNNRCYKGHLVTINNLLPLFVKRISFRYFCCFMNALICMLMLTSINKLIIVEEFKCLLDWSNLIFTSSIGGQINGRVEFSNETTNLRGNYRKK